MRTFTVGVMAAAVLFIFVPARGAEFFEDFDDGTYDTDYWTHDGDASFDSGCCILTNRGAFKLKVGEWQPPLEMRARMVGDGEVSFTIASNYWVKFSVNASGSSWRTPNDGSGISTRPAGTNYDFHIIYDGTVLQVIAAGVIMCSTTPLPLIGKRIEFSSSTDAKLDFVSVKLVLVGPALKITRSDDKVILMWPTTSTVFTLRSSADVTFASWVPVPDVPDVVNGSNVVTQRISGVNQFYRLTE